MWGLRTVRNDVYSIWLLYSREGFGGVVRLKGGSKEGVKRTVSQTRDIWREMKVARQIMARTS